MYCAYVRIVLSCVGCMAIQNKAILQMLYGFLLEKYILTSNFGQLWTTLHTKIFYFFKIIFYLPCPMSCLKSGCPYNIPLLVNGHWNIEYALVLNKKNWT
jgi:hypothetical protein